MLLRDVLKKIMYESIEIRLNGYEIYSIKNYYANKDGLPKLDKILDYEVTGLWTDTKTTLINNNLNTDTYLIICLYH